MYNFFWRGVSKSDVIAGGGWISPPDSDIENGRSKSLVSNGDVSYVGSTHASFFFWTSS